MEELGEAFLKIYNGTDNLVPWENKNPLGILDLIDQFIQKNWH